MGEFTTTCPVGISHSATPQKEIGRLQLQGKEQDLRMKETLSFFFFGSETSAVLALMPN